MTYEIRGVYIDTYIGIYGLGITARILKERARQYD